MERVSCEKGRGVIEGMMLTNLLQSVVVVLCRHGGQRVTAEGRRVEEWQTDPAVRDPVVKTLPLAQLV